MGKFEREHKAAGGLNEAAAAGPTAWAKKLLEKSGWTEGKGLGKNEDGTATHVKVTKKNDTHAIGFDVVKQTEYKDCWYDTFGAFGGGATIGGAAAVELSDDSDSESGKRSKKRRRAAEGESMDAANVYATLFESTGGARLGMRARASQPGKLRRAEVGGTEAAAAEAGGAKAEDDAAKGSADNLGHKAGRKEARRIEKEAEEKKLKKARRKVRAERREQKELEAPHLPDE
jgi:Pin2-interacting protein X1